MAGQKVVHQRRDVTFAKGGSAGQLEYPGGPLLVVADGRQRFLEAIKQLTTMIEVDRPRIGELQAPGGAVKQLGAELGFQPGHQPAHMGAGYPQMPGGIRKGAPPHHFHKGFNTIPVLHYCYLTIISCRIVPYSAIRVCV